MEIDSIKMAKKLNPYCQTILIAKENHFIANEMQDNEDNIILETINFSSNLGLSLIFGIRALVKKHQIKNVIFFGASELKSMYFSFLGLDINLIIRHGTTKSRPKKDWFHRLIYSKVNYHVAICKHLAKNIEYIIPFGKGTQLKAIYPSLNLSPSQEINFNTKPHKPLQILHVGRIAKGKGQKTAIEACKILYKNKIDFKLNIIGGFHAPYKKNFLSFINTLKYKEKINLVGHTTNLEPFYLHSDIFLFPSDGEGLSNAFIEALSYGLHCISYKNTSFPELKDLGFNFLIAENQDLEDLKQKLLSAVEQDFSRNRSNALLAKKSFSFNRELEEFKSLLY